MDTEVKELAVMPTFAPCGVRVVTTVTPVANWPSVERKSRRSNAAPSSATARSMNASASSGSNHQGKSVRGSSNPLASAAARDSWCRALASTSSCQGLRSRSMELVHTVENWPQPRQNSSKVRSIHSESKASSPRASMARA